jgi:hypothetical protein
MPFRSSQNGHRDRDRPGLFCASAIAVWRTATGLLSTFSLAACGASLPHPPYAAQATTSLVVIPLGPPPGRIEVVPRRPARADAWVDGEWVLRHGRWYWLLGRWVQTPVGARYAPWVVVRASDGTPFYAPSFWQDAKGMALPPPPGLEYAKGNGQAVFDPEGEAEPTGRNVETIPPPAGPSDTSPR